MPDPGDLQAQIAAQLTRGIEGTPIGQLVAQAMAVPAGGQTQALALDVVKDFDSQSVLGMLITFMLNSITAFNTLAGAIEGPPAAVKPVPVAVKPVLPAG
jgi:hypothetical protein